MDSTKKWIGGGIPFGYRYDEKTLNLVIDDDESRILRMIFSLVKEGFGVNRIANELNNRGYPPRRGREWTSSIISYILSHARLNYYLGLNRDGSTGDWQAILSKEEFERLTEDRRKAVRPKRSKEQKDESYLLSGIGILKCGYCGGNVKASVTKRNTTRNLYYYCSRRLNAGPSTCRESRLHRQDKIDPLVLSDLRKKTSKDIFDLIVSYTEKLKGNYQKEVIGAFTSLSEEVKHKIAMDPNIAVPLVERGYNEIMAIKKKYCKITVPEVVEKDNLGKSITRNIETIVLFNDNLEITYKFPIAENLSQTEHIYFD